MENKTIEQVRTNRKERDKQIALLIIENEHYANLKSKLDKIDKTNKDNKQIMKEITDNLNDKFISNPIENVVIYTFNEKCEIIIIQHADNIKNNIFNKENLNSFFDILINAKRNDSYIIQYDYDMKYYKTYFSDSVISIPKELKIHNSTIVNIITSKPIENDNINS